MQARVKGAATIALFVIFSPLAVLYATPCGIAIGNTYYVTPTGNDGNNCSSNSPCRQIRKALTLVQPGDTIYVADGSYLGFTAQNISGTSSNPITIQAQGTNAYVERTTDRSDNRDNIFITFCQYLTINGLNSTNAPRAGLRIDASPHITVRNGRFGSNTTWGVFTDFSDDLLIENNECHHSFGEHGVYHSNSGDRPVIRGNRCHDNHANGIHINADESQGGDGIISGALIENNIIYNNGVGGGSGINMDGVQNSIIRNNLLYNNHATGIGMYRIDGAQGPKGNQVYNNTVDQAVDARWALLVTQTAGTNIVRNNILHQRNPSNLRGCILYDTTTDANTTDSAYNAFGGNCYVSTDDAQSRISLVAWQGMGHETNSFCTDITNLVVNPLVDYHQKTNSPAIDAGQTLTNVLLDLDYFTRPAGNASDIGCYEFGAAFALPALTIQLTGPDVCISFPTLAGKTYRIERTDDLTAGFSTVVADAVPGTGGIIAVPDPEAVSLLKRFYRVRIFP